MDISNLVQNFGFPVACVFACGYYIWQIGKAEREENAKREQRHYEQMDKFSTSLDKFNETLIKIDARLGEVEKKLE